MAKLSTRLLCSMGLLPLFMLLLSCGFGETVSGKAQQGKVLDVSTQKPIADAIVVALWQGHAGYSGTVCFHVETTTTDDQGAYHIPAWKKKSKFAGLPHQKVLISAHKPGYQWADKFEDGIQYLQPFTGTREERLAYLKRVVSATSCDGGGDSRKDLYKLYETLFNEAKGLIDDKEILDWFRWFAAHAWLAQDKPRTSRELNKEINEFLKDHLR